MLGLSRKDPSAPPVLVPYQKSGHMIRGNNTEILGLAEQAAFAYWITRGETYARFAADIYWTWLLGTCYMQPPLDPDQGPKGPGGYAPGGIMGYYDYEQIDDDLMFHAAPIHDFLHDRLNAHPSPHLKATGKDLTTLSGEVFKRFINIGFVRGGKEGNWNVNGWNIMMRGILALEPNAFYPDGRDREYYLHHYTTESTPCHDALPDILKQYDAVTGLWPESPGYALGTINTLLDLSHPLLLAGQDTIGGNPMMQKAALAAFTWLDARGNLVVFGDTRGGPGSFLVFERLLTYHRRTGDTVGAALVTAALRKGITSGQYDRADTDWTGLCANVPLGEAPTAPLPADRTAWSPEHRHLVMKNGNDENTALMFTLYGGTNGKHLSANGLALQLYGRGYALAPDASAYESYWTDDRGYHQEPTGSNTILPGYTEGPVTINALDPAPAPDAFTASAGVSPSYSFADFTAAEKRRLVAMVRTSPTTGFYVDIFRSRQKSNDYLYHNLGDELVFATPAGQRITPAATGSLTPVPDKNYRFFKNIRSTSLTADWLARWSMTNTTPALHMALWMQGAPGRTLYQVDAPPTTLNPGLTPGGASSTPKTTPTIIVRQTENDGWASPFVAVFEPYAVAEKSITSITGLPASDTFAGVIVESADLDKRRDLIISSTDDRVHSPATGTRFQAPLAIVTTRQNELSELYLGSGRLLQAAGWNIAAATPTSVSLRSTLEGFVCSTTGPISITRPGGRTVTLPPGNDHRL